MPSQRPARYGRLKAIRVDQGSQFTSKAFDLWAYSNGVTLDFSRPGKPTDNACAESQYAIVRDGMPGPALVPGPWRRSGKG